MLEPEVLERIQKRVGTVIRRKYTLDRLLGVGGMGSVYAATHRNGSRVALKVLHPELARLKDVRARFLREGYVANKIAHPAVTRIIDDDDDDEQKTVFLVMELLDGESVDARWERHGRRLPVGEVLGYADRLLDVLVVAHEQGVVHRDLKPENLFVTTTGDLKVLDFGIARLLDGTGATVSGQLLGTPAFMPPEQANGRVREIDARSDLWSVGALVFTMLAGVHVHEARHASEQLIYAATQEARKLEAVASWVPRDVSHFVNRALSFDRDARWPSAREMQQALRATRAYDVLAATSLEGTAVDEDLESTARMAPKTVRLPAVGTETLVQGSAASAAQSASATSTLAFDLKQRRGGGDPE